MPTSILSTEDEQVMNSGLTTAEYLKFEILAKGITVTPEADRRLHIRNKKRIPLTPADYASTTGIILRLEDNVWVNAPTRSYNSSFVNESHSIRFDWDSEGFFVEKSNRRSRAWFCPPPLYHDQYMPENEPYNNYVYTHADRVRVAPIQGCAMVCKFCNIPYEDRYGTKDSTLMLKALEVALDDSLQPAHHVLISGGTPHKKHYKYLQNAYRQILDMCTKKDVPVDIMMVPLDELLLLDELRDRGVNQLSINVEIIDKELSRKYMRNKIQHGLDHCLQFIEKAANCLGPGRVRSMLMVGLEPSDKTLRGVELILKAGGIPVLSPFRPSAVTPLADLQPPSIETMIKVYTKASSLAAKADTSLGPHCAPCTHNTITLARNGSSNPSATPYLV